MLKNPTVLICPAPARQDARFRKQGLSEQRGEEVQTAPSVDRSPFTWVLAKRKAPPVIQISERLDSTRCASERSESDAREKARLGARALGGREK